MTGWVTNKYLSLSKLATPEESKHQDITDYYKLVIFGDENLRATQARPNACWSDAGRSLAASRRFPALSVAPGDRTAGVDSSSCSRGCEGLLPSCDVSSGIAGSPEIGVSRAVVYFVGLASASSSLGAVRSNLAGRYGRVVLVVPRHHRDAKFRRRVDDQSRVRKLRLSGLT